MSDFVIITNNISLVDSGSAENALSFYRDRRMASFLTRSTVRRTILVFRAGSSEFRRRFALINYSLVTRYVRTLISERAAYKRAAANYRVLSQL